MRNVSDRQDKPSLAEIKVRQDDFSLQASLPDDPKFWIRVERDLGVIDGVKTLIVSDLSCGSQGTSFAGYVLADLTHSFGSYQQIRVLDVYPSWSDDPRFEVELERRISDIRSVLKRTLNEESLKMDINQSRGKYNVTTRFK